MHGLVLSLLMLLADGSAPTQLTGKVVDPDGNPVSGATVQVYSATPKKGAPTMDTWEYPDCKKSAVTDAGGGFVITEVNPAMLFEVLVLSEAHRPLLLKKVDPVSGQITAKLKALAQNVEPELTV